MKLAEALILRADYQRRLQELKTRILRNAKVQEGQTPAEDATIRLAEVERVAVDLDAIIRQINATNSSTQLEAGQTLADALAHRDALKLRHRVYLDLAQEATVTQSRLTRSEIRFVSAVNVAQVQSTADALAREHREIDARIQEANWLTELMV